MTGAGPLNARLLDALYTEAMLLADEAQSYFAGGARSDLSVYTGLLERYLGGELDDREFEFAYTTTFRDDDSLRSREEVEVLGSIFGDVDRHMEMHMMMGGRSNSELVRQRAAAALEGLKTLAQTPA